MNMKTEAGRAASAPKLVAACVPLLCPRTLLPRTPSRTTMATETCYCIRCKSPSLPKDARKEKADLIEDEDLQQLVGRDGCLACHKCGVRQHAQQRRRAVRESDLSLSLSLFLLYAAATGMSTNCMNGMVGSTRDVILFAKERQAPSMTSKEVCRSIAIATLDEFADAMLIATWPGNVCPRNGWLEACL